MPTYDWPEILCPNKATWGLQSNTESFTSPLNRSTQTVERPGARWTVQLDFPPLNKQKRRALEAFVAGLGGMAGRFRLWPMGRPNDTLPTLVTGYSGAANNMVGLVGFVPGAEAIAAGSYLQINGELKIVVNATDADENGKQFVTIAPPFRSYPPDLSPVTTYRPSATFRLVEDQYAIGVGLADFASDFTLTAVEVF